MLPLIVEGLDVYQSPEAMILLGSRGLDAWNSIDTAAVIAHGLTQINAPSILAT